MKILTVCVLGCTIVVLAAAAEAAAENDQTESQQVVKKWLFCPFQWTRIKYRCFRFVPHHMTWAQAERNCQSMGGTLASVHSISEYHNIQKMIRSTRWIGVPTWIGGSGAPGFNIWHWSDGSQFDYTNWCSGVHNNYYGEQHCLQMNYGGWKCWENLNCYHVLPSVCAKKWRFLG